MRFLMESSGMSRTQQSVLIIEDEYDLRIDLAEFFNDSGWRVETASTGREALLKLGSADLDVWIVDLRLPDMDGLELLKLNAMQEKPAKTLVLTSSLDNADLVNSLKLGCDIFLNKSASLEAILSAVNNLARRAEQSVAVVLQWVLRGRELYQTSSGNHIKLTPSEICLLSTLGRKPNALFKKDILIAALNRPTASYGNLEVFISRLRRKLTTNFDNPPEIIPLYGSGYMIDCEIAQ
jgi:DNA-binding response OmpR family regulator